MIRAKIWFHCAAMHDPVTPIVLQLSLIGWEAKKRRVGTQIERTFNGEELVLRMKGWITVDPNEVIEVVNQYGDFQSLQEALRETFAGEVEAERVFKK
jgi:hypothetical protein